MQKLSKCSVTDAMVVLGCVAWVLVGILIGGN